MTCGSMLVTVAFFALLPAHSVRASPLFEILGGVSGGGSSARFSAPNAGSSYFNPALLPWASQGVTVGYYGFQDAIELHLGARDGVDVPLARIGARNADGTGIATASYPTSWVLNGCDSAVEGCTSDLPARPRQSAGTSGDFHSYAVLGLVNRIVDEKLVLGVHAVIPLGSFTGGHQFFVDEREQFFTNSLHPELFGDRLAAPSIAIGVASRLIDQLSLGIAFTVSLKNIARAQTFVPDAGDQSGTLLLSTEIDVIAAVAPHFSIVYQATDAFQLSAVVHSPSRFEVDVTVSTLLPGGDNQGATRAAVLDYMPWQFALGANLLLPTRNGRDVALTGGATYRLWSRYIDRQNNTPTGDYAWSNTLTPTLGASWAENGWSAAVNLSYVPTPVPEQTGRSNYVDSSRFGFDGSFGYDFQLGSLPLRVDLNGQWQRIFERSHTKSAPNTDPDAPVDEQLVLDELPDDAVTLNAAGAADALGLQTNNPGWPGYSSRGYAWGVGLNLTIEY